MDNEKEQTIDFKPSVALYIFLFIFYSIWLMQAYGAISHYLAFGFDSFLEFSPFEWMAFILVISAGLYSFYAVIKTLRGDSDCITALKWSLILVLIYTLFNPSRAQISTSNPVALAIFFFFRPTFYLIFYLYLCFAKSIKRRYPKDERTFGPSGWIWTGFLTGCLALGVFKGVEAYRTDRYCKPVEVEALSLAPGEVSDGYVVFSSDRKWEPRPAPSDTVCFEDAIEVFPTIQSSDSTSIILLSSGRCDMPTQRIYNRLLTSFMRRYSEKIGVRLDRFKEISFSDTVVSGNRLLSTVYEVVADSASSYVNLILINEAKTPKSCFVIYLDRNPIPEKWGPEFARNLRFDLQQVSEGQNYEHRRNPQDKYSDRIPEGYHYPYNDMAHTLLDCLPPRHLLRIMALKDDKGKVAYRERGRILQYF